MYDDFSGTWCRSVAVKRGTLLSHNTNDGIKNFNY